MSLAGALKIPAPIQPHLLPPLSPFPATLCFFGIPPHPSLSLPQSVPLLLSMPRILFLHIHLLIQLQPSVVPVPVPRSPSPSSQVSPVLGALGLGSFSLCAPHPCAPQFLAYCLAHIGYSVAICWKEFLNDLLFCKQYAMWFSLLLLSPVVWG